MTAVAEGIGVGTGVEAYGMPLAPHESVEAMQHDAWESACAKVGAELLDGFSVVAGCGDGLMRTYRWNDGDSEYTAVQYGHHNDEDETAALPYVWSDRISVVKDNEIIHLSPDKSPIHSRAPYFGTAGSEATSAELRAMYNSMATQGRDRQQGALVSLLDEAESMGISVGDGTVAGVTGSLLEICESDGELAARLDCALTVLEANIGVANPNTTFFVTETPASKGLALTSLSRCPEGFRVNVKLPGASVSQAQIIATVGMDGRVKPLYTGRGGESAEESQIVHLIEDSLGDAVRTIIGTPAAEKRFDSAEDALAFLAEDCLAAEPLGDVVCAEDPTITRGRFRFVTDPTSQVPLQFRLEELGSVRADGRYLQRALQVTVAGRLGRGVSSFDTNVTPDVPITLNLRALDAFTAPRFAEWCAQNRLYPHEVFDALARAGIADLDAQG